MRINNSLMSSQVSQIGKNNDMLSKIYEKLATGKRINRASDDASSLAVAKELEKQVRGLKQGGSNIGDAMSALNIAEGAGNEVSNILQRQRELAIQSGNGTLTDTDRQALNSEYQALNKELDRIAESTQYNKQSLTNAGSPLSDGTGEFHTGPGADDRINSTTIDFRTATIGAVGDISTAAGAQAALSSIDSSIDSVNGQRVNVGSLVNRMEHQVSSQRNQEINSAAAQSMLEDLDFAAAMVEKSRVELLGQSSQRSLGYFQDISRNNLSALLG
jgi:flagellin